MKISRPDTFKIPIVIYHAVISLVFVFVDLLKLCLDYIWLLKTYMSFMDSHYNSNKS